MRNVLTIAILVGTLSAVPVVGFGATPKRAQSAAKPSSKATTATHATTGIVKSMDATKLVITLSGKKGREMTFTLDPSTQREGTPAIGSSVSVRYHDERRTHMATAIVVQPAKQQAAHKAPAAR